MQTGYTNVVGSLSTSVCGGDNGIIRSGSMREMEAIRRGSGNTSSVAGKTIRSEIDRNCIASKVNRIRSELHTRIRVYHTSRFLIKFRGTTTFTVYILLHHGGTCCHHRALCGLIAACLGSMFYKCVAANGLLVAGFTMGESRVGKSHVAHRQRQRGREGKREKHVSMTSITAREFVVQACQYRNSYTSALNPSTSSRTTLSSSRTNSVT
jgi:hypothetical protein